MFRPGPELGDEVGQLLAQLQQPGLLGQLAIDKAAAQGGEALLMAVAGAQLGGGLGEEEALYVARTALQGEVEFGLGLHALGDQPAAGLLGHLRQRLDRVATGAAPGGGLEQAHVQLEDVRLQIQDPIQLRIAGTEIVDGDADAEFAIAGDGLGQAGQIASGLGDLVDDPARRDTGALQLRQAGQFGAPFQLADPARREIEAEKPVIRCAGEAPQRIVPQRAVEVQQVQGRGAGIGEQGADGGMAPVILAQAPQGFDAGDAPGRGVDEGLEEGSGVAGKHKAILIV